MGEEEGAELGVDGAYEGHTLIAASARISLTAVLLWRVVNTENRCNRITLRVDSYSSPRRAIQFFPNGSDASQSCSKSHPNRQPIKCYSLVVEMSTILGIRRAYMGGTLVRSSGENMLETVDRGAALTRTLQKCRTCHGVRPHD